MKFKSKAHMAQELINGKRFFYLYDGHRIAEIYYDAKAIGSPFRNRSIALKGSEMKSSWDDWNKDIWEEVEYPE